LALDELANVAPLPRLASIVSEGGGQGVLTMACLQDLSQARSRWGTSAEGFLSLFPTTVVLPGAEHYTDLLRDSSARHGLSLWRAFGKAFQGVVLIKRGDPQSGIPLLRGGVDDFGAAFAGYRNGSLYGELAAALGRAGQVSEGLATIQEAVDRTERNGEGWIMPELLRVKGELLALHGTGEAADEAESCFRWALNRANEQNASAWELRAATSLARLPRDHDRSADAIARLRQTYDRFTEGFETADLRLARTLLATLS
jgi:hypothetical protein